MNSKVATIISIVFHPLLMATNLFIVFTLVDPMLVLPPGYSTIAQWLIVLVVFLTTFVIPVLSLVMLKYTGNISSLKLEDRKERAIPSMYITLFYGFTAYYFNYQMMVTELAGGVFILVAIMIFLTAVINFFWKISVHGVAVGGMVGILLSIAYLVPESGLNYILLGSLIISGLVLSARLKLQAHTQAQVYLGFLMGLLVSFMIVFWV